VRRRSIVVRWRVGWRCVDRLLCCAGGVRLMRDMRGFSYVCVELS
jgi:hypothetical protein